MLDTDQLLAMLLQVVEELSEQPLVVGELEAERAPDGQVVGERGAQRAHDAPPGHGRATVRSASRSTLA